MDGSNEELENERRRREQEELEQIKQIEREKAEELRKAAEYIKEREKAEREQAKKDLEAREKELQQEAERIKKREREELEQAKKLIQEKEAQGQAVHKVQAKEPISIAASLRTPGSEGGTGLDTVNLIEPVYYVIVGRGPAAVINHTTLRQTEFGKKRIEGLPVMHIGFANPWTKYMQHGMGQPPHLLSLPGFAEHPRNDDTVDEGLNSRGFAACVENEFQRLVNKYPKKVVVQEAWVVWIQTAKKEPLGEGNVDIAAELRKDGIGDYIVRIEHKLSEEFRSKTANFRLLVMKPKHKSQLKEEDFFFVYASFIDVCTGPGRPNVFPPASGDSVECVEARTPPWLSPDIWDGIWGYNLQMRKVLNGVEAIRDEVPWSSGERVCVTAGGGVGLNAAERSRNQNCKLDWFGRTSLMDAFNNPRNDTILRHPTENRTLRPGESKTLGWEKDDQLIPCKKELRYGYGAALHEIATTYGKIVVSLAANKTPKIKDYFNKQVGFTDIGCWDSSKEYLAQCHQQPTKLYDRLVIPNGQESKSLGHPYFFARHLKLNTLNKDGRMIGLQTGDGKLRVLGAAAQVYTGFALQENRENIKSEPAKKMWGYWDSLPVSAVPDGFIFSGVNIAVANEFFDDKRPNRNVNTATEDEIAKLLEPVFTTDAKALAKAIVEKRKRSGGSNGYTLTTDLIPVLKADDAGYEIYLYGTAKESQSLDEVTNLLDIYYTPSIDSDLLPDT